MGFLPEGLSISGHEQGKAAVACIVDLMLVSMLGVSACCLPREAWHNFVCSTYPSFSGGETFPRVHQTALALSGLSPVFNYLFTMSACTYILA